MLEDRGGAQFQAFFVRLFVFRAPTIDDDSLLSCDGSEPHAEQLRRGTAPKHGLHSFEQFNIFYPGRLGQPDYVVSKKLIRETDSVQAHQCIVRSPTETVDNARILYATRGNERPTEIRCFFL